VAEAPMESGIIKIDGMDVRGLKLDSTQAHIGVVFQEAMLFNRSIADNLRVGRPDATEEEMRKAASARRRWSSSSAGDSKFDTNDGTREGACVRRRAGKKSGMYDSPRAAEGPADPDPDEATRALDGVTERRVNAALDEVMGAAPQFVIAHPASRPSATRREKKNPRFKNGPGVGAEHLTSSWLAAAISRARTRAVHGCRDKPGPRPQTSCLRRN